MTNLWPARLCCLSTCGAVPVDVAIGYDLIEWKEVASKYLSESSDR